MFAVIMALLKDGTEMPMEMAKQMFLDAFLITPRVGFVCETLGLNTRTFYHWKERDEVFAKEFELHKRLALTVLEDEAWRRAVTGVNRPVFQGGIKVGEITDYSDSLLTLLLKANAPSKYKEKFSGELTGADGRPLQMGTQIIHVHSDVPLANSEEDILDALELPAPIQLPSQDDDLTDLTEAYEVPGM